MWSLSTTTDPNGPLDFVEEWYQIKRAEELDMEQYNQRFASVADNQEVPLSASPGQSPLAGGNSDRHTAPVPSSESSNDLEQHEDSHSDTRGSEVDQEENDGEMLRETYEGEFDLPDPEERTGVQLSHGQVEEFVQTLSCVEISSLGPQDVKCLICQWEYGKERGITSLQAPDFIPVIPGQDLREYPVELPCGHVFGDWCISIWLRGAHPPSCPICRSEFQPVR